MPTSTTARKTAPSRARAGSIHATRELFRERWCDEDGNIFTVVAWRGSSSQGQAFYTLADGTPVQFKSNSVFRIVPTGVLHFPCED